jgi:two-component system, chemotaxis family, protein-glutamate methylesterase/glutaminase
VPTPNCFKTSDQLSKDAERRLIVMGASAGGIESLSQILPAMPATFPIPIAIVIHQIQATSSLLTSIFQAKTKLLVKEIEDKTPILPGAIYFTPPQYHSLVEQDATFALSTEELVNFSRPSIDVLFESAAEVFKEHLIGILLTGANGDGARGLKQIHFQGGITVVQDPETALFSEMPRAALRVFKPDHVWSLESITEFLTGLG